MIHYHPCPFVVPGAATRGNVCEAGTAWPRSGVLVGARASLQIKLTVVVVCVARDAIGTHHLFIWPQLHLA